MARRRTVEEITAELDAKSARLKAESDRRLSVAADGACELMFDAEKALRALAGYCGLEGGRPYKEMAERLEQDRINRWADLKARKERT